MSGILYVHVKSPREAEQAEQGGADRLVLTGEDGLLSPLPQTLVAVRRASTLHLRVMLRSHVGSDVDGGEMTRLKGLASSFQAEGADGFVFGFLNPMTGVDVDACCELAGDDSWNWTFDRTVDAALDQDRAWEDVRRLPRLDSIMTAGSARDVEHGIDRLISHRMKRPAVIAAGGLRSEHVPWLVRGGVTQFLIEPERGGVDAVRSWRRLVDQEIARRPSL
jgi:copper homeostasis protein